MEKNTDLRAALEPLVRESFEPKIQEALDAAISAAVKVISPTGPAPKKRGRKPNVSKEPSARIGRGLPPKTPTTDDAPDAS
jgi:hypothetical protein